MLQKMTTGTAGNNVTSLKHQPKILFSRKKHQLVFYPSLGKTELFHFPGLAKYRLTDEQTHTTPHHPLTPDMS